MGNLIADAITRLATRAAFPVLWPWHQNARAECSEFRWSTIFSNRSHADSASDALGLDRRLKYQGSFPK